MNPARFAFRHAGALLLVTALVAAGGALALFSLPSGIYPTLHFPRIVIIARSGTLPARAMVLEVTRPIEQVVMEVPGIRRVRSRTFRGATEISAQFEDGTDTLPALQQVQSRIAEVRGSLPPDVEVAVERITLASFPILSFNLTGGLAIADLRDTAYYVMRPALSRVRGIGRVDVQASDTREIEVVLDPAKARAAGVGVEEVAAAVRDANRLVPVGRFPESGLQHLALVSGLYSSVEEIGKTPLTLGSGRLARVGDVATVFPGAPDRTLLVTGNGRDAAVINISQQPEANILEVKAGVEAAIAELARTLPSGLRISKVYDLAELVARSIRNVWDAILVGGLLAVLVLVVFLRSLRLTVIAALTLPLTVLGTFLCMRALGQSINLMSMGGLAVAIGLVIDDAVVVVEGIHRRAGLGAGAEAIAEATSELVAPVVGSTLTTVVVLAPLGLLQGVVGQFFRALSITLSVAVLISLFLALTLIPLLASWGRAGRSEPRTFDPGKRENGFYPRTLGHALARPGLATAGALGLGLLGLLLFFVTPSGFLPYMDEGGFVVDYATPSGTALEATDRSVRKIEAVLAQTPEVAVFTRRTGSELGFFATEQNSGDILVRLKPRSERRRSADEVIIALRAELRHAAPGVEIEFVQLLQDMIGDLEGNPNPIEVKIFGDDEEALLSVAEQVESALAGVAGVVDLVGPRRGNPELTLRLDQAAIERMGLTLEQVTAQLSSAWLGEIATDLRVLDRTVPVRVRYPDAERFEPASLAGMLIRNPAGKSVPLSSLGRSARSSGQTTLLRENLRTMALVTARLEERDLGSAVAEIRRKLATVKLPIGSSLEVGGQQEAQSQAFRDLLLVLAVAAALVLLIMVYQFRAFVPALVILAAAPLSFGGAFLLLWITGTELNVSSAMGLILLVGLVVKNGIVLLDYARRLEQRGEPLRAAVQAAARTRVRPILMTTLCTLFGLLPLALGLGAGAELQKPLALAVIGGLGFSTLVTLYAVPAVYVALETRAGKGRPHSETA